MIQYLRLTKQNREWVTSYASDGHNTMRACTICGKGSIIVGKRVLLRGHYNLTSKSRKYPNLQWVHLPSGKRTKACVSCIRKLQKTKV